MNIRKHVFTILAVAALALSACSTNLPISASPINDLASQSGQVGATVVTGLQDAAFNFDNAVAVGALDKNDPAPACVHGILADIGQDVTVTLTAATPVPSTVGTGTSYTPKISDLISAGSVAYIRAQQAKKLLGGSGLTVPVGCEAIVGKVVIDGANKASSMGLSVLTGGLVSKLPISLGS